MGEIVAEITKVILKRSKLFMLTKIQGNFTIYVTELIIC